MAQNLDKYFMSNLMAIPSTNNFEKENLRGVGNEGKRTDPHIITCNIIQCHNVVHRSFRRYQVYKDRVLPSLLQ